MKTLDVAAGVIFSPNHRVLIAQRKKSDPYLANFWEFPGGKQETGETLEDCLVREIDEEFKLKIFALRPFDVVKHKYDHVYIRLYVFLAKSSTESVECSDHQGYRWIPLEQIKNFEFAPADVPVVEKLVALNHGS